MLVPERFRVAHPGYRAEYLATPSVRLMGAGRELFGRRKDGSAVPVEIGLTPFRGAHGKLVLASIVDITERRQREIDLARERSALAHLSRVTMLGELSGSLAHELNQPLTAILSNAQAALRFMAAQEPNLEEVREILAEIVEDNSRAGGVIRRLRALFRKGEPVFERLDLASIIADVTKFVHSDAVLRHVELIHELEPGLPAVRGDRVQLQQVMLNLLLNAFDAFQNSRAADRRVIVTSQPDGHKMVLVRVRDNGPGLSGDVLDRIFEPFFTTKSSGMGMGLSISRSIIAAHGGTLKAENYPGGGAMFWFALPRDDQREVGGADGQ
jgi:two-component system sensor kinase FixL